MQRRGSWIVVAVMAAAGCGSTRAAAPPVPTTSAPTTTVARTTTVAPTTTAAPTTTVAPEGPPWRVVTTTVVLTDPTRPTPARGGVPGHAGRALRTVVRRPVTRTGAPVPGRIPFVVFAHGYAVATSTYAGLLDDLAASGIVVAAPELPGESTALPGPPNEADLANEPCDLEFVAGALGGYAPVVFAGHSDGATAAVAAGYEPHACAGPRPVVVVAMAPDNIPITVTRNAPALLAATGTNDRVVNPQRGTETVWRRVPTPAWLLTVAGGSHLGTFTTDPDRARVDAVISAFIRAHTVAPATPIAPLATGRLQLLAR